MTDDQTLVANVLAGDMQAFRLLIKQHERLVSHMVGRLVKSSEETEELCQDVFLKVHDKLGEFSKAPFFLSKTTYGESLSCLH
jgi:RNA polymerase sigma-70 factor, ECF subfamily